MSELRASIRSLGIADPEAAISVHALLGPDPELRELAGTLPQTFAAVPEWVKSTFLDGGGPLFELAERSVPDALGATPDERIETVLSQLTVRPRTAAELRDFTGLDALETTLEELERVGLVRSDRNPLEPGRPFWSVANRLARFYYAMMAEHLPRWRRGYITDRLWRMTHARFDRYVCRPEYARVAREWALDDPAAATTTRIVVPDPRFRQLRTLELAVWGREGDLVALGTIRWMFTMRRGQLQRLRHVRRLLGDPPARLYCVAPKVDAAIAADQAPDVYRVGPAHLLKG